jgi:phospholipase C
VLDHPSSSLPRLTQRHLLRTGAGALAGGTLAGRLITGGAWASTPALAPARQSSVSEALAVLGRSALRHPDSVPAPGLGTGTDTMPAIEHVVVLMLENHSYDNFFGMLGRGPGQTPRGDGFALAADGRPTATNPYPYGRPLRAFPMPTACQLDGKPSQEWEGRSSSG